MKENTKRTYTKTKLSPAKRKFAVEYAKRDNATEAVRRAYPELAEKTNDNVLRNKGSRLLTNANVMADIKYQKERLQLAGINAVKRIEHIIDNGKEHNALQASMYVVDQVHGKATQQIETKQSVVSISIDLTEDDTTGSDLT